MAEAVEGECAEGLLLPAETCRMSGTSELWAATAVAAGGLAELWLMTGLI